LILFVFIMLSQSYVFTPREAPEYEVLFDPQDIGWLGADVSTSIHLGEDLYLWLWGDTLVGNCYMLNGERVRHITRMPHSSLALVHMNGNRKPEYIIPVDNRGVFYPKYLQNSPLYYWIVAGEVGPLTGKLYICAMVINNTGTGIGFEQLGSDIIIVDNPQSPPDQWQWNSFRLPYTDGKNSWGAAISSDGAYLYLVGLYVGGQALVRIPEVDMANHNFGALQFYSKDNRWLSGIDSLVPFLSSPFTVTETTLMYHPNLKKWYMVGSQAYQSFIYVSLADNITGPWQSYSIYTIPAPWSNGKLYINYAAKVHPEFQAKDNEIVFTYNTNSVTGLQGLASEIGAYHPHFIVVTVT